MSESNEQHDNIFNTLKSLAGDLDALGWDQPARIYHLIDDENDPTACLAGIMPTHPVADMQAGFDAGMRVPPETVGLLIANEGYRHLAIDEVLERNPLMRDRILDSVRQSGVDENAANIDEVIASYYHDVIIPNLPGPTQMPPFMRAEVRTVCAVLRDGTTITYGHTRGKEEDGSGGVLDEDDLNCTNVPKAMYLFLNDLRPDADCDDPRQRVADSKTLEFLANLPTTED